MIYISKYKVDSYVRLSRDDGYSDTSLDRSGFNRLLDDRMIHYYAGRDVENDQRK